MDLYLLTRMHLLAVYEVWENNLPSAYVRHSISGPISAAEVCYELVAQTGSTDAYWMCVIYSLPPGSAKMVL